MKPRILMIFSFLLILWGALILRGGWLQIIPDARLKSLHDRQFQTIITLQARRGAIVDRNGRDLALSMTAYSLYADPKLLAGKKSLSRKIAKALGMRPEAILQKIKDGNRRFVWLARLLPLDKYEEIKKWEIRGLSFVEEFQRVYPNDNLMASTLGFIGQEGQGLEGLELQYDAVLHGDKKKIAVRRDARGRPLVADGMMFAENIEGSEIKLTIESDAQHMLEMELAKAVTEFDADQAFGIVLHAKTSEVIAMANTPTFNLNRALKVDPELRRNRPVTDGFEPGSVMKTFSIAAALKENKIAPNTRIDTNGGVMKVGDRVIRESDSHHKWDHLTVSEVLAYSSNVGTTKIAFMLGAEGIRKALVDFGFGSKSGIDLPGEAKGTLQALPWRPHLFSNISFGHGVAVTPLQIANAYAAIANGGILHQPYVVQSIRNLQTGRNVETKPKEIRRVLSPEDAASMRMMLAGVTALGGTGVNAKVDGFVVAGKTGTAQKVNATGTGYLPKGYISSFAGFIPANNPQYVIYVVVDHPKKNSFYGSEVAAPLFSKVASYLVRKEGLAPLSLTEKNLVPRIRRQLAGEKAIDGSSGGVGAERPLFSGAAVTAAEILNQEKAPMMDTLPDLGGLTARQVLQKFSGQPIQVRLVGQGTVVDVYPGPGTPMVDVKKITVIMK